MKEDEQAGWFHLEAAQGRGVENGAECRTTNSKTRLYALLKTQACQTLRLFFLVSRTRSSNLSFTLEEKFQYVPGG